MHQEWIAFALVALAVGNLLWRGFRQWFARPISQLLLKNGQIGWALKVRACVPASGCGSCPSQPKI